MPCGLVPSREPQTEALKSCERPGFPALLQSAQTVHCRVCVSFPSAQSGAQLAAAAFYSPPAFVWVRAPTTGSGGVQGSLRCRAAPQTLAPPASMPPGFASVAGKGLPSAACSCLRSPQPGAAVAAAPPARAARWYSRAPKIRGRGAASEAATPMGQLSTLQRAQTRPPARPLPLFLGSHLSPRLHSSPRPPSLGRLPASWTFEGIPRSSPEGAAKPRLLAPSLPLPSIHRSGTRAQSQASSRTGLPSSFSTRSACTPRSPAIRMARNTQRTLALGPLRENQGGGMPRKRIRCQPPAAGWRGFTY